MADTAPRTFPLNVVLSLTTDRLMCSFDELHELLDYLTGDLLFTHQLPRAAQEVIPAVLEAYPDLPREMPADVVAQVDAASDPDDRRRVCLAWTDQVADALGVSQLTLSPASDRHTRRDPLQELVDRVGPDRVIAVVTGSSDGAQ